MNPNQVALVERFMKDGAEITRLAMANLSFVDSAVAASAILSGATVDLRLRLRPDARPSMQVTLLGNDGTERVLVSTE